MYRDRGYRTRCFYQLQYQGCTGGLPSAGGAGTCWIASRNIQRGAQWAEEIDKAIQNARIFVVIISANSVESKQVPKKVALAVTGCEGIFPFRIDETVLQGSFRYTFYSYGGKMGLFLEADGQHYTGKEIRHLPADESRVNFFERVQFAYEDFDTDWYAVAAYDGNTLFMLDESWNEVILTRVTDTE